MAQGRKSSLFKTPADCSNSIEPQTVASGALARPRHQLEALSTLKTNALNTNPYSFAARFGKEVQLIAPSPAREASQS
jgi:hypothetical protein